MDREKELQRLSEADRHVATAEKEVAKQMFLLEQLRRDGHDTSAAEKTLKGFEDTLQVIRGHREQIFRMLEQIDKGLA
jgi:hypothetical protein